MSVPKKNHKLELVKFQSTLKKTVNVNSVMAELNEKINQLGNIDQLEDDPSFVEGVCVLVENITTVKLSGEEKLNIAIQLITDKFPSLKNSKEVQRITKQIAHLVEKGLIKKVSRSRVVSKSVQRFFANKLNV
jgi:iron uptake system EfeUOB component EfeO/EfeM